MILGQLERELEMARNLDPKLVVRPLRIERGAGLTALVLEACPYPLLADLLGDPLETETFIRIAIGVAEALVEVHGRGLVHKQIQPQNIFATVEGNAKLTGFGVASSLSRELQAPGPLQVIAETLAYVAPEQTGRMNRSIDSRSDLYALGVVFYQMLTGQLPFSASEPMEWVHCHIALQPRSPREHLGTIPETLSDVVTKLLAKAAEERYQTADGLKADLERCLKEWQANGRIEPFQLGAHDIPDRLLIPEKLYGRDRELAALHEAFDRVAASGKPVLVLISGYSGVGKSAVVQELRKTLAPPRGFFAAGKFDQYKRDIPYATLAQAFEMLIRQLLGKGDAELGSWRQQLQEALEPDGQLIVDLVPELKLIIGEQPPAPELEPQQAKARFQLVFRRFIRVFARPEHPLAVFFDDLQWLDTATLDLIQDLVVQEDAHLLLLGAYRDNEVGPEHPLKRRLADISVAGVQATEIALAPLLLADLTQMVADSLHCELERAGQLAELVHAKTAGNPFFVIQFLTALAREELLVIEHAERRWSWDLSRIQAMGYTDNVAELMAAKLTGLPNNAQTVVQQLACLGTSAHTGLLALVSEMPEEAVDAALQMAVGQELIQRFGDSYRFVNDRVQEAAYLLIPETRRAATHLRIGELLLANTPEEEREESVFEIVSQLNHGVELVTSPDQREELARLNLLAGKRAKGSTAYAAALTYLNTGASLLSEDRWERQRELAFALEMHRAECEFLTGQLEAAQQRLTALFSRATSTVERASTTSLCIDLYTTLGKMDRAVDVGLGFLRHLGTDWSAHPTSEEARREYDRIWSTLGRRSIEDLVDQPLMHDPSLLATMEVLIKLRPPALFTDANLVSMVSCRAVNLSLEHGNTDGSCFAYASLGIVAGPRYGNYEEAFRFGRVGYDLVEQRGLKRFQARTYTNFGIFVVPWAKHVRAGRDLLQRAFDVSSRSGDFVYSAYACNNLISNLLMAGDSLVDVEHEARKGLGFLQKVRFGMVIDIITSQLGLIRSLRGLTRQLGSFDDEQLDERELERHLSSKPELALAECWHWIRKLQARFTAGDSFAALEASARAERLLWSTEAFIEVADYHFFAALTRAACYDAEGPEQRQLSRDALAEHLARLDTWAKHCPENFENRAALVGAEIARIEDRPLDAMHLYEKAIQSARANRFIHNEALAHELAGRFYLGRQLEATGIAHLCRARACYASWGADGKTAQLDRLYPKLDAGQACTAVVPASGQLDLETVAKASQALSGEIELPSLVEALMASTLENAGADRGLLILSRSEADGYEVEVEATATGAGVEVGLIRSAIHEVACPETVVNYVTHTQRSVILDDASRPGEFLDDAYWRQGRARSAFCLPLLRRGRLIGVLYLENTHAAGAFTPDRTAVLDVLAAQAAISLETARLYADLREENAERRRVEENVRLLNQELEQRVQERTAELEAANQELEAFAYSVSHDLRAPLRHIDGFVGLLDKEAGNELGDRGRHLIDSISVAAGKMARLIDDLLSFSRLGRQSVTAGQVDLGGLVRDILGDLEPDLGGRSIEWSIGDLPAVTGDGALLRVVLVNLISNALKFTQTREQARIEVGSLRDQTSEAVVFVRDNGVGFDMANADKLFGVFQRLHRAEQFAGTGIGLATAHRIIVRHGGRIWAEAIPDQGAAFYFSLPRQ
jgi:predicted ATPase/signal transduction histidine kinase